jgi:transketolase
MRKQFVATSERILEEDPRLFILLGDIGVFAFRNSLQKYPDRVLNIGILEQATVSVAAGLAKEGFIPLFHSIAPFVVERAFEQIKVDFGYQKLGGNFVSVGASYDYASLGCTHHCPGDVGILATIPGMEVVVPGHPQEYDLLFQQSYANGNPTYYRLTERANSEARDVKFGRAAVLKKGAGVTVLAVGALLDKVLQAATGTDATVLYYTTVLPFDRETLARNCPSGRILCVEPFYQGTLAFEIMESMDGRSVRLSSLGVPREFIRSYGHADLHDVYCGFTVENIRYRIEELTRA